MEIKLDTKILFLTVFLACIVAPILSTQNQQYETQKFPGQPVKVLSMDAYGNATVHFKELTSLLNVKLHDRKIVVVTVVGAFREGKSFFLGYCLRYLYATYKTLNTKEFAGRQRNWMGAPTDPLIGFTWKPGRNADTNGILFWDDIFLYDNPETGEKSAILLMDTQGLFEPSIPDSVNARIIGLATIISSVEVFNIKGYIKENQLQYLEMSTQFTKLVQERTKKSGQVLSTKPFQNLIFLQRDWEDERMSLGYEGGETYKKEIMSQVSDNKAAMNVRKNIDKAFDNISFCLLPHPGTVVTKQKFNGSYGQLDEEFVDNFKYMIESIFAPNNLRHKKVFGKEVTGIEFANMVREYFDAYSKTEIPETESLLETAARREIEKLKDILKAEYDVTMNADNDFDDPNFMRNLNAKYLTTKENILRKLRETPKIANEDMERKAVGELSEQLDKDFLRTSMQLSEAHQRDQAKKKEISDMKISVQEKDKLLAQERASAEEARKNQAKYERTIEDMKRDMEQWKTTASEKLSAQQREHSQELRDIQVKTDKVIDDLKTELAIVKAKSMANLSCASVTLITFAMLALVFFGSKF